MQIQYSLQSLVIAVLAIGALMGAGVTFWPQYERRTDYCGRTKYILDSLSMKSYICGLESTRGGRYPQSMDELKDENLLEASPFYYTNPRMAELDVGFFVVGGLTMRDVGAIWVYENLPEKAGNEGRYVLRIGADGYCERAVWLSATDFAGALKKTMDIPGIKVVPVDRVASRQWPLGAVHSDRVLVDVLDDPRGRKHHIESIIFGAWRKDYTVSWCLLAISVSLFAFLLVRAYRHLRAESRRRAAAMGVSGLPATCKKPS